MYDLIIIGSGPAGLTASIYASRYRMNNLVIGKLRGGTIGLARTVENFPGFKSISGLKLMEKIEEQAVALGGDLIHDPAKEIKIDYGSFFVFTESGQKYQARTLIFAPGTQRRKLNIPGEEKFLGRGLSYCTTCDSPFFRDKIVALVGGSDAAVSGAILTSEYARKVYIIYRGDCFRAEPIWVEKALKNPKIEPIYSTNVIKVKGSQVVEKVILDKPYKGSKELPLDGVFIEIGGIPGTSVAKNAGVVVDENGFIKVDRQMQTNIKGIFAAGDATDFLPRFQQMISASAMGALAAASAYQYLKKETAPPQRGDEG